MVTMDHLGLDPGCAEVAIVTGDPDRAAAIAAGFGAKLVTTRRGFPCYVATDWLRPMAVVGAGIGGPSTAIVAEELIALGVRAIIRIGTCGGLQPEVKPDHLIVSTGCVRDEGTTRSYIDLAFPALAHPKLCADLAAFARVGGATVHMGVTHSKDAYYSEKRGMQADEEATTRKWRVWREAGVLATEMEAAALFIVASLRRVAAAGIFVTVGKTRGPSFDEALQHAIVASQRSFASAIESGELKSLTPRRLALDDSFLAGDKPASKDL